MKGLLSGCFDVFFYDRDTMNLIAQSETMLNTVLNLSSEVLEARAGADNAIIGRRIHSSGLTLTCDDIVWDINYLKLKTGAEITAGANMLVTKTFECTTAGEIEIVDVPVAFANSTKIVGEYKRSGETQFTTVEFTDKKLTIANLQVGEKVCIRYMTEKESGKSTLFLTELNPMICHVILKGKKYATSATGSENSSNQSISGDVQVEIPMFQFDASQEISLTPTDWANTSLSGSAYKVSSSDVCDENGGDYYGIWSEVDRNVGDYDNVSTIVIANSDIDLKIGDKHTLQVYMMYNDGTSPKLIDNSKLTITSGTTDTATIASGVVTAVATGTSTIEAVVTDKSDFSATATVTVTAS